MVANNFCIVFSKIGSIGKVESKKHEEIHIEENEQDETEEKSFIALKATSQHLPNSQWCHHTLYIDPRDPCSVTVVPESCGEVASS